MRSAVKTRGLISVTLLCCVFILFLPNFNVLPDRRFPWGPNYSKDRKLQKFECILPPERHEYPTLEDWQKTMTVIKKFMNNNVFRAFVSVAVDENNTMHISSSSPGDVYVCSHQQIIDIDAGKRYIETEWSENFTGGTLDLENISPHVRLFCTDNSSGLQADYFLELPPKAKIENVKKKKRINQRNSSKSDSLEGFNALVISLSGLSRREFALSMKLTMGFLKAEQYTVDFRYHSQNGFSRLLNLYTLLAGKPAIETAPQTEISEDLIWKHFHQRGYITVISEDDPEKGTLNLDSKHFKHIDFSTATLVQVYNHAKATYPDAEPWLIAPNPEENFYLDYGSRLLGAFRGQKMFLYLNLSNITTTNSGARGEFSFDYQLATFLSKLKANILLENTVLFIVSDFAQIVPESKPHLLPLYISLPKTFVTRHPMVYETLKNNSATVTTNLDVYATLLELADGSADAQLQGRGQSLFKLIPQHRSCESVLVHMSLCPCQTTLPPQQ